MRYVAVLCFAWVVSSMELCVWAACLRQAGLCPCTPQRAIGPLDTLLFVPCELVQSGRASSSDRLRMCHRPFSFTICT